MSISDAGEPHPVLSLKCQFRTIGIALLGAIDVLGSIFMLFFGLQMIFIPQSFIQTHRVETGWLLMIYSGSVAVTIIWAILAYSMLPVIDSESANHTTD